MDIQNGQQGNQQNMLNEVTRLLCQAQAVRIKNLQNGLPELIQQCNKALDENQPELADSLWKQVAHQTQEISHLFNQVNGIMYGAPQRGRQQGRNQYGNPQFNRNQRGQQSFSTPSPKQLNQIVRKVTEEVLAAA
jgi:hypothetical protein